MPSRPSFTMSIPTLDGLRFVAALMVMVLHFDLHIHPDLPATDPFRHFNVVVDMFFVISGIVIATAYEGRVGTLAGYRRFIGRRLARLYPLHLVTLLFYALLGLLAYAHLLHLGEVEKYRPAFFIPNLLLVHAWGFDDHLSFNFVSWSISAEFFLYLAFPLIAWLTRRQTGLVFVSILAMLVLGWTVAEKVYGLPMVDLTAEMSILRALPAFTLGVWLVRLAPKVPMPGPLAGWLFHASLAASLGLMMATDQSLLQLLAVYAVVIFGYLADRSAMPTLVGHRVISRWSRYTYSIYMLHPVVATVLFTGIALTLVPVLTWPILLTGIPVTLVVAIASYHAFENPLRRRLSGDPVEGETSPTTHTATLDRGSMIAAE